MSSSSIEQDEELVKKFRRTPSTPIKSTNQTPRRSSRKRSLFQPSSPTNSPKSDDLGPISPLSPSSSDSYKVPESPYFSPNGSFSTPPRTPVNSSRLGPQERISTRKIEVTSSLFPSLHINTLKSHKSPCTPKRSQRLMSLKSTEKNDGITTEDILRDLTTPPRSSKKRNKSDKENEDESYSSQNICGSTPRRSRQSVEDSSVSLLGIKTISCESFYGPSPATAPAQKRVSTQLFIDTLDSKLDSQKRRRSLSLDSITSNRSFVSGSGPQRKKKPSDIFNRPKRSKRGAQKGPHVGVWHGVKKPKKMKFNKAVKKPCISPTSRVAKMLEAEKTKPILVTRKRLFEEKPRRRIASRKEKSGTSPGEAEIIDPFSYHLIKRKKLPMSPQPANEVGVLDKENDTPDPNKKFMKYGVRRKATFTLNETLKLQFSDGVMKLQSPKKKRKLYSGKVDVVFDFCDDEPKNSDIKENIGNILSKLEAESDRNAEQKAAPATPIKKVGEYRLRSSPRTQVRLVNESPGKVLAELQNDPGSKLVTNLSSLALDEVPGVGGPSEPSAFNVPVGGASDSSLEKTVSILSHARKILCSADPADEACALDEEEEQEEGNNSKNNQKFFSLFYKQNWNSAQPTKEANSTSNSAKKKRIKIPDDQYLLDAGQKSIGIVTCGKCGVMYQAGDFADEATHRNFHDHLPELRFTGWTNERVVGKYLDGRVLMIVSSDPKSWWHKVNKIVDIVDQELGFTEGSVNALFYKTVYLFISDKAKQIVGCLIAEECKEAYKMFPPLEGVDVDSCSKDPSPCKIGISRIWTALNHRRRGVAKRMIDCMCRTFMFGEVVPMDLVAFSVPSPSGKLLAQNVTGKLDFLVYGFA